MSFKLYIDKSELFEASVKISGANVKESKCRLILHSDDLSVLFEGNISNDLFKINLPKMKDIFKEGVSGTMKLEVIADDSYFEAWTGDFVVEQKTKVEVQEPTSLVETPNKNKLQIEAVVNTNNEFNKLQFLKNKKQNNSYILTKRDVKENNIPKKDIPLIQEALRRLKK